MHIRGACDLTLIEVIRKSSDMFVREIRNISRALHHTQLCQKQMSLNNLVHFYQHENIQIEM